MSTTKMDHILLNLKSYLSFHHRNDISNLSSNTKSSTRHFRQSNIHSKPVQTNESKAIIENNDDKYGSLVDQLIYFCPNYIKVILI